MRKTAKVIIAGEGGQGIQTIAKIIASAAATAGSETSYIPSFGVEQRGAPSVAFLIIGQEKIHYPRFDAADLIILLQQRAVSAIIKYISLNTAVIFDESTVDIQDFKNMTKNFSAIPAAAIAAEKSLPKSPNILMLGALTRLLNLRDNIVWQITAQILNKKMPTPTDIEKNHKLFLAGKKFPMKKNNFNRSTLISQNKPIKTSSADKQAIVLPDRCKSCGICLVQCPVKALSFGKITGFLALPIPEINLEKCAACGACSRFCPDGAIAVVKKITK